MRGGCVCGAVRWEAGGPPGAMWYCHCTRCRKAGGGAFATWLRVDGAGLRWLSGEETIARFPSSEGVERAFCTRCGSPLPHSARFAGEAVLPAGGLECDPGVRPAAHTFVSDKAAWYEIHDDLPRFDAGLPGSAAPEPDLARPPRGAGGSARGSCLCGGAVWEVPDGREHPGRRGRIKNCFCSRCRRASGSAHDACLVLRDAGDLRWLAGRERSVRFHLPGSRAWIVRFCRTCGSPLPPDGEAGCVPAGALDGDPGARPSLHIHTASKPSWFEIHDGLPAFPGAP